MLRIVLDHAHYNLSSLLTLIAVNVLYIFEHIMKVVHEVSGIASNLGVL